MTDPHSSDSRVRDEFEPLRALRADDAAVARAVAAAAASRQRDRPRWRLRAVLAAAATAAVAGALASLPGNPERASDPGGASVLRAAAAVAADRPPELGVRYTEILTRIRQELSRRECDSCTPRSATGAVEQRSEEWVDSDWAGRRRVARGRVVEREGDAELLRLLPALERLSPVPREGPIEHGDTWLVRVPIRELPTDGRALRELLVAAYRDQRWAPDPARWAEGHPTAAQERYDVARAIVILLASANGGPDLRAALFEALAADDGVRALGTVDDGHDRLGTGVELSFGGDPQSRQAGTLRVVFDPRTSELLSWSLREPIYGGGPAGVPPPERAPAAAGRGRGATPVEPVSPSPLARMTTTQTHIYLRSAYVGDLGRAP